MVLVAPSEVSCTVNNRRFTLPVRMDPKHKGNIEHVKLYLSDDRGRTWRLLATRPSDCDEFLISFERDGVYWFAAKVVDKNKVESPIGIGKEGARVMKVRADRE
ncbi:MAG TPA: hypothetical protein VKA46_33325 [Gemmataceae bacterium]|nr:hypothetical protein [Gemmataceae bacterium]